MSSMEESTIEGQNENKKSRLPQPEHESVEVKYMVMVCDALAWHFIAFRAKNRHLRAKLWRFLAFSYSLCVNGGCLR